MTPQFSTFRSEHVRATLLGYSILAETTFSGFAQPSQSILISIIQADKAVAWCHLAWIALIKYSAPALVEWLLGPLRIRFMQLLALVELFSRPRRRQRDAPRAQRLSRIISAAVKVTLC